MQRNADRRIHPQPRLAVPAGRHEAAADRRRSAPSTSQFIDAQHLATRLLGDAIYANLLLLGYAWQLGLVPVSAAALDQAIELNGTAVDINRQAFLWGRRAAVDPEKVAKIAGPLAGQPFVEQTLDELIASRVAHLTAYQNAELAARYQCRIDTIRSLGNDDADAQRRRPVRPPAGAQGRVRGRPPVHRDRFPASASAKASTATCA